jgi:hypothetical protein
MKFPTITIYEFKNGVRATVVPLPEEGFSVTAWLRHKLLYSNKNVLDDDELIEVLASLRLEFN